MSIILKWQMGNPKTEYANTDTALLLNAYLAYEMYAEVYHC